MGIKMFSDNIISPTYKMRKLTSSKKREVRKLLLQTFEFSTVQVAKKALGMRHDKADVVYDQLMVIYNEQIDQIRKDQRKTKYKETKEIKQSYSIVIHHPDMEKMYNVLMQLKKTVKSVMVTLAEDAKVIQSIEADLNKTGSKIWSDHLQHSFSYNSSIISVMPEHIIVCMDVMSKLTSLRVSHPCRLRSRHA
jgi:hypothetical protein